RPAVRGCRPVRDHGARRRFVPHLADRAAATWLRRADDAHAVECRPRAVRGDPDRVPRAGRRDPGAQATAGLAVGWRGGVAQLVRGAELIPRKSEVRVLPPLPAERLRPAARYSAARICLMTLSR